MITAIVKSIVANLNFPADLPISNIPIKIPPSPIRKENAIIKSKFTAI